MLDRVRVTPGGEKVKLKLVCLPPGVKHARQGDTWRGESEAQVSKFSVGGDRALDMRQAKPRDKGYIFV